MEPFLLFLISFFFIVISFIIFIFWQMNKLTINIIIPVNIILVILSLFISSCYYEMIYQNTIFIHLPKSKTIWTVAVIFGSMHLLSFIMRSTYSPEIRREKVSIIWGTMNITTYLLISLIYSFIA